MSSPGGSVATESGAGGGSSAVAGAGAATAGSAAASDAADDARERDAAGDPTDAGRHAAGEGILS